MRDHGKLKKLKKIKVQRGRPTKLTPELVTTLINALQRSAYVETAIAYAGINKDTYYEWVREGARASERENKGEILDDHDRALADFSDSVKKALALAELKNLETIQLAGKTNWTAAAWMLERRYPERYSRRDRMSLENPDGSALAAPLMEAIEKIFGPESDQKTD